MKLFIDTADVGEIREAASWGVLDGVTTNPSLVAKTGRDFETVLHEICALVDGPVSAEVVSTDAPGMVEEGVRLALLAAKAGAAFISPFVGRLDDVGHDGMELIAQLLEMLDHYTYPAEVLVASVRNPLHVIRAAQMGAHIATCPFAVLQQLVKHPLTDAGLERFLADWKKAKSR